MEETGMAISILPSAASHPQHSPAKSLAPHQRQALAVQALAKVTPITKLADHTQVSRKFIHQQKNIAQEALQDAFNPHPDDDRVLFYLPVTKTWLHQFTLALVFINRSSFRSVVELLRDLFNFSISIGTVHNIVRRVIPQAREYNNRQNLSPVRIGLHDEIFQGRVPVLTGLDADSTFCYLLSQEAHRDADTWGVRLLELQDRGFTPDAIVADAGSGLRAGQAAALPNTPCRSDVFHAQKEVQKVGTFLENQAYKAMKTCEDLQQTIARRTQRGWQIKRQHLDRLPHALHEQTRTLQLADEVALLADWLSNDVLSLAGPPHAERIALFDFILAELQTRVPQAQTHLHKLVVYLSNQRDDLLAFTAELDGHFDALSKAFDVAPHLVRELFAVQTLDPKSTERWQRDATLRRDLGERYFLLCKAIEGIHRGTVRASSLVENLNGRLRNYLYLRRHLGNDYLTLLQFFLNHRRYLRSKHPERVGKSPAELLTGQNHPHWLEMLGYTLFSRN
jgi:hypothetical protein